MQIGKLPHDLLARLIGSAYDADPRVIVGPRVGEDAAAVDLGDGRALVLKADPITFASDLIGWYAVHVNTNDIAVMGAEPSFFLATLLLPERFDEEQVEGIFRQLGEACREVGAVLVGGHTEVTHGIADPILAGAMVGEAPRERLVLSSGGRPGDRLLLTKGIAIEGSSVLARDFGDTLLQAGVQPGLVGSGRELLFRPGISVLRDCRTLLAACRVDALHDPTEGGLAAAVHELALASGCGAILDLERVPLLPETAAFAAALGLDPLAMLASGALVAAVPPEEVAQGLAALAAAGIAAAEIGELTGSGDAVILRAPDGERPLEPVVQDEVARFVALQAGRAQSPQPPAG